MLQGHGETPYQRWQDGARPSQLLAQDFLSQSGAGEVDSAAHTAAAQVREPHSMTPLSCACPAPAPFAACLVIQLIAPAWLGCSPAALGQSTQQPPGPVWALFSGRYTGASWQHTDAHAHVANLPLALTSRPDIQNMSAQQCFCLMSKPYPD